MVKFNNIGVILITIGGIAAIVLFSRKDAVKNQVEKSLLTTIDSMKAEIDIVNERNKFLEQRTIYILSQIDSLNNETRKRAIKGADETEKVRKTVKIKLEEIKSKNNSNSFIDSLANKFKTIY